MDNILIVLITGMAVLGAYYLAELITEGVSRPKAAQALLVITSPVDPADVLSVTGPVRRQLPRCQVVANLGGSLPDCPAPVAGLRGVAFVTGDQLHQEVLRQLDLQSAGEDL